MGYVEAVWKFVGNNAAAIIALCALGLSIYQALATRRHNRLSVRPHLVVFTDRSLSNNQATFVVKIRNTGLGPAIVKSYVVFVDGNPFPIADGAVVLSTLCTILSRPVPRFGYHRLAPGDAIARDQELVLLSAEFNCANRQDYETAMKCFERVSARLSYASMYGEPFEYDSRVTRT
jgi:hypothetical protein